MIPLNAQDFGFLPTNTGTDNRTPWAEAIKAAQDQNKPLYIPAGAYALELTANQSIGVTLHKSVTIYGDGPEHTVIDIYPKTVSFPYTVMWWDTPDLHVSVRGLKVLGPTGTDAEYPHDTPECEFMKGITAFPYGSENRITIDDVVVTGKFRSVIWSANGDGLVEVRNSDITALSACVLVFETTNTYLNKRFHADNCRFASGVPEIPNVRVALGVCVYLHPHVAARVTNCSFHDNPRVAIKQYGEGARGNAPKYSNYFGCSFFNCPMFTIITPGEDIVTLIEACSFDQGYLGCRNDTNVIGCDFRNSSGILTTILHREQFEVNVVGCSIRPSDFVTTFPDAKSMSLLIRDCVFTFDDGSRKATGVSLAHAPYGEVSNCRFVARNTSGDNGATGIYMGPETGSRNKVESCSFSGTFAPAPLIIQPGSETDSGEVNSCDFSQVVGAPIHFNTLTVSLANGIRGRDNIFNGHTMTTGGSSTNMITRLRPRQAMAAETVVAVPVTPATSPPTNRIILDRSYNTFHVKGSRIDYVEIWLAIYEKNKFEGPVHLIADTPWRLTKNGNVRPLTIAQRPVGGVVTLFHDPVTGLWYEA